MKRKMMSMLLAAALGISLAACGSSDSGNDSAPSSSSKSDAGDDSYTIAWVDGNLANESNAVCTDAAKKHAESLGINFQLLDGQGSGEKQVSQCETLIEQKVDCVIVQPYDAAACQVGVQECIDAGINVLVTKTTIEDNSICPFVGQDDVVAGEMEMQWVVDQLNGKGNIVILEGPTGISAAINRNDGIKNILAKYPDIKILNSQPADWNRDEGMALMETWLQTGQDIDAVVAHNDEMALGAYDAIASAGLEDKIKVIGIDAIDAAKKSVAAGELNATVLQDVESIADKTIDVALAMCKGEEVDDVYYIDPILLTSDNIGDYK
jgi:ABC-type sugar transport system substrate-binding protein